VYVVGRTESQSKKFRPGGGQRDLKILLVRGSDRRFETAYVVIHESSKKRSITGCVTPAENGMSVTDEKDKRSYALSGDTADIKPGDRMTLQGKNIKPKDAGKPLIWETKTISKDFGVCQPRA
jgi:hypothetical protein